ncbi:MAG TPA: TonB-dependent receptor [Opitutaceae bacterium]|nr:TonB-dependent receptor [Opitutaceae bacterium]
MQTSTSTRILRVAGGIALFLAFVIGAYGQGITTSAINGLVTDKQGKPIAGATVTIVHDESGTTAATTTRPNGQYNISGLRPGGPYTLTVASPQFTSETVKDINLELGDSTVQDVSLGTEVVTMEKFTVSSDRDITFGAGKIGTSTSLSSAEIAEVPTVRRDIQDIAQLDSRLYLGSLDQGGQLSAQGQNFRYNSFLIDGVQSVDTFGLNSNGFSSLKSPIPLDAIQSFSVDLSPYDVRRAGFTGALLNAVIKSGTNQFHGSARFEYTGQNMRAKNPVSGAHETFRETTPVFTFSGPIIKDKLFFFLAYEEFKRTSAPPQAIFIPDPTVLAAIVAKAKSYGYEPGDLIANNTANQRTTIAKLDWNIVENQRLSVTYRRNYGKTTSFANYTGSTSTSLSNYWFTQPRNTDSYTAQLFSQWTPNFRTEATASYTKFDGSPANNGTPFPQVQVQGVKGTRLDTGATITNGAVYFGTESSRQLNQIKTKEAQGKFSGEYSIGDHTITAGVEEVATTYNNAYVQFTDGYYTFASPATWDAGTPPNYYQLAKAYPGFSINDAIANWRYDAYGAFVQDTWHAGALTLLGGLRMDYPYIGDKPPVAAGFSTAGFTRDNGQPITRNDTTNSGNWTVSPRLGFVYNLPAVRKTQFRGGIGLFQGKSPAVWISNAYSNAGSVANVTATSAQLPSITFNKDVNNQPVPAGTLPTPNINITDPKLIQPAVWKTNLAVDHKLPFGDLTLTIEGYYIKTYEALQTEFLNYQVATTGPTTMPDGRIRYAGTIFSSGSASTAGRRHTPGFADVLYLTNTNKGDGRGVTVSVERPFRNKWSWGASWTHGRATEVTPMTSSVALSNYQYRASFNPNEDTASISNTNIKDRVVARLTRQLNLIRNAPTTVSFVYQWRTGHPYSWVFRGDANGDGFTYNDLLYVPTGPDDPAVRWTSTAERDSFFAFVNASSLKKYMGTHAPRNSETSPGAETLDIKLTQEIPVFRRMKLEVYANLLNIGNMLNSKWGLVDEYPYSYRRNVAGATYDAAGNGGKGQWIYTFNSGTLDGVPVTANDTPISRWQVQAGILLRF